MKFMADNLDKYLLTPSPLTASKLTKEAMKCLRFLIVACNEHPNE